MNAPTITMLFAGLCAFIQVALTALVIRQRLHTGVGLLDGGDPILLRRMRAHGNFSETAPAALLLLALLEVAGLPGLAVYALGATLVLGRSLHAAGLLWAGAARARVCAMVWTMIMLSAQGVLCLRLFAR